MFEHFWVILGVFLALVRLDPSVYHPDLQVFLDSFFLCHCFLSYMGGFGDNSNDDCDNSWSTVLAKRGRGRGFTASQGRDCVSPATAPPHQTAPPSDRAPKGSRKAFKTVFTSSVVHAPVDYVREEAVTDGGAPLSQDIFVVGVPAALKGGGLKPTLQHVVFDGVEAGWIGSEVDLDKIRRERKGRAFLALGPTEHAPPGSVMRRERGFVTVRVPATVHRNGGILVPREWAGNDWWEKVRSMDLVAAMHVRADRRLDLVPRAGTLVTTLSDAVTGMGLLVDETHPPIGRKLYLTAEHAANVPVTAVALALRETVKVLEAKGCVPLGCLLPRTATQVIMPLLQVRPGDPTLSTTVSGMKVLVRRARMPRSSPPPGEGSEGGETAGAAAAGAAGAVGARDGRGDAPAPKDGTRADSRGPVPRTVLRRGREAGAAAGAASATATATTAEAVAPASSRAMDVDESWETQEVTDVPEGPGFIAYVDRTNPLPKAGPGGFAAAAAVATASAGAERSIKAILCGAASDDVVRRIAGLGSMEFTAPLFKRALEKDAREARLALGLDGGPDTDAEGACFSLCKLIGNREVTMEYARMKGPVTPDRWRALINEQGPA